MRLEKASYKAVSFACLNFHYAKSIPVNTFGYSVFNDNNEWCGVVLYGTGANNNLASQYGLKPKEIKNILENKLNIDPELFLEILENVFKVNIILFCRNRISNKEGSMCKPKFKKFFILNPSKKLYDKTVILYKTDGGEFDKLDFPHTELVVLENNVKTEDNVGEITTVFNASARSPSYSMVT